jgi:hypothetical protein
MKKKALIFRKHCQCADVQGTKGDPFMFLRLQANCERRESRKEEC